MRSIVRVGLLGLGMAMLLAGCGDGVEKSNDKQDSKGPLTVAVVNYPLAYFAERIGGDQVEVVFPTPADEDPAFWSPSLETIARYQQADLILLNGASYAKWVPKATLPRRKLVDTSGAFADRFITIEHVVTHAHGPGGDHAHAGTAFTTWLDFSQAILQADAIREALVGLRPEQETLFQEGFAALEKELLDLDRELVAIGKHMDGQPLLASHPVYQYLARRYGLNVHSVMWEPESVPSASQWHEVAQIQVEHPARWMIWEGTPAEESAHRLEGMGVSSLVFAPCMNRPENGDFLSVMLANVAALEALCR